MSSDGSNGDESPEVQRVLVLPMVQKVDWAVRRADKAARRADSVDTHVLGLYESLGKCTAAASEAAAAAKIATEELAVHRREMNEMRTAIVVAVNAASTATTVATSAAGEMREKTASVHDLEKRVERVEEDVEEVTHPGHALPKQQTDSMRVRQIVDERQKDSMLAELAVWKANREKRDAEDAAAKLTDQRDLARDRRNMRYTIIALVAGAALTSLGSIIWANAERRASHEVQPK